VAGLDSIKWINMATGQELSIDPVKIVREIEAQREAKEEELQAALDDAHSHRQRGKEKRLRHDIQLRHLTSGIGSGMRVGLAKVRGIAHDKPIVFAVSGKAFNALLGAKAMRPLLLHTRIFARMVPSDKVKATELHMERGITASCGDGGNDCGMLRAAHVGLALSGSSAAIVAPFASTNPSLDCCHTLLLEGRAALSVSFGNYTYLIAMGQIVAFTKVIAFKLVGEGERVANTCVG